MRPIHHMTLFHKTIGHQCPSCNVALPLSHYFSLLGDTENGVDPQPLDCPDCQKTITIKGRSGWRLFVVYFLPATCIGLIWGPGFAAVLNILLLPFMMRVIGLKAE